MIPANEKQSMELEEKKVAFGEKMKNCGHPMKNDDETFQIAMAFLKNPYQIWSPEHLEDK